MASNKALNINNAAAPQLFFTIFVAFSAICIFGAVASDEWLLAGLPLGLLLVFQTVMDYKKVYFLLFMMIPLSIEFYFSDSLATDLPTEPLMIGLMLVYFIVLIARPDKISGRFWSHPLSVLLILHLVWILFTTIISSSVGTSLKFFLAKLWYITTFYFLAGHILRQEKDISKLLWVMLVPLALATCKVLAHHFVLDFGFKEINKAVRPFFRNHVNYAAILALVVPYAWMLRHFHQRFSKAWWILWGIVGILLIGVSFAYTRAAYVALAMAVGAYWVIRFKLARWAVIATVLAIIGAFTYLVSGNKFMDYAPTERTISHKEFGDIVSATYKLEDVSTMERYYRWIGGVRMSQEHLWTGFGPGNFYNFYKGYTLNRFETYVSDNPERSGIHNYYLMLLVEQGIIGLLIFVVLSLWVILKGEKIYHASTDIRQKALVMAVLLSTIIIDAFLLINDLIESDKIGSFFFFNIAVLVFIDLKNRQKKSAPTPNI